MKMTERRHAVLVCWFIFFVLGFVGWLENSEPARPVPQPGIEQMVRGCDREVSAYYAKEVPR